MRRVLALGMAVAALLTTTAAACEPGVTVFDGGSLPELNTIALLNQKRVAAGCSEVARDPTLTAAADRHVVDMRDRAVRDHTGSDGSTPDERIREAGFSPASATGEIMYWADRASDYREAVAWWMDSPTHRAIIENCTFTHVGVGLRYPGGEKYYAVVDFGTH